MLWGTEGIGLLSIGPGKYFLGLYRYSFSVFLPVSPLFYPSLAPICLRSSYVHVSLLLLVCFTPVYLPVS